MGFDGLFFLLIGNKIIGTRNLESPEDGVFRNAIPEINDMIDNGREASRGSVCYFRVGCGQNDLAVRFERDAIVPFVEMNESLGFSAGR